MIEIKNLSKSYGNKVAVNNISFDVKEGENLVLLGTSGCGKTTTLRMINRLTEPDSGTININGQDITQQNPQLLRRNIGYVLQHTGLFPHYTVAENIAVVPKLLKWSQEKIKERTNSLLQKLHLDPKKYAGAYPDELSGGQQQRVGLARALMADPPVLLMDEPFGALDPLTRASIRKEFLSLDEFKNKTIIIVTHDVEEAFEMADCICLMNEGKIIQIGTPEDLLFKPANEFVSNFLNEQQLALELKNTKISTLWQSLTEFENNRPATETLSAGLSVWEVMRILSHKKNTDLVEIEHQQQIKKVDFKGLLNAFALQKF